MRGAKANGRQIRSARQELALTQEQVASLGGIDVKTVRKAEQGQRLDLTTLTRIGLALKLTMNDLIVATRSTKNLELHRRDAVALWYQSFDARDLTAVLSVYHDDAILHLPGAPVIPFAGEHRGKQAIRRTIEQVWSAWPCNPLSTKRLSPFLGDDAVILFAANGLRCPGGDLVSMSCVHIFTFPARSSLVMRQCVEFDTLKMASACGRRHLATLRRDDRKTVARPGTPIKNSRSSLNRSC